MRHLVAKIPAVLAVLLALASCGTLQRAADEGNASLVARLLNEGKAGELAKLSSAPFLLDGEIIALPADIAVFWDGAVKAGLKLDSALVRALPVASDTWREFGSSREVQIWFKRYVQEGARLFELATAGGERVLVLLRDAWFSRTIYGFRGPFSR